MVTGRLPRRAPRRGPRRRLERFLGRRRERGAVLVAERDGVVTGFANLINVDPDAWGTGAGRALLQAVQAELARLGFEEAVLWVLPANARARRFYEIAGWACDGTERTMEVLGVVVPEVRYRRRSTSEESSSATPAGTE